MAATPSKRKVCWLKSIYTWYCNTCCICSETWESVVRALPTDMVQSISNFPTLLYKMASFSSFCTVDSELQGTMLSAVLGDESPLISRIKEIAQVSWGTYFRHPYQNKGYRVDEKKLWPFKRNVLKMVTPQKGSWSPYSIQLKKFRSNQGWLKMSRLSKVELYWDQGVEGSRQNLWANAKL